MNTLSNRSDVIDSRDVIERIEVLRSEREDVGDMWETNEPEDASELAALESLQAEAEDYATDWPYGATLIRRSYFTEAMDELVADCYEMPKDLPSWMTIALDYGALEQDYTSVDFDGVEYLIR
jgi:hypothetical protein